MQSPVGVLRIALRASYEVLGGSMLVVVALGLACVLYMVIMWEVIGFALGCAMWDGIKYLWKLGMSRSEY